MGAPAAFAQSVPANLIVSGTTYADVGQASTLQVGSELAPTQGSKTANTTTPNTAVANGQYQNVFLNTGTDAAFGVTSQIFLQDYTTNSVVNVNAGSLVGSFSSKSELALNLSSDGTALTFSGYNPTQSFSSSPQGAGTGGVAAVTVGGQSNLGLLDISNSNTPGLTDPTNSVNATAYRSVGQVSLASLLSAASGSTLSSGSGLTVTNTNAYSGNNGRAVVSLNGQYYVVGNAGNSGKDTNAAPLNALAQNTGVQTIAPGASSPNSTVVGACSTVSGAGFQCGYNSGISGDKTGKDDNFRGLTVFNGNLYVTKGSGSNGVNSVYEVTGLSNPSTATIAPLAGFPNASTANPTATNPFGVFLANPTTMYVAYEGGDGIAGAGGTLASKGGLSKYSLVNNTWTLDYTITGGLGNITGDAAVGGDVGKASTTTFYTDGLRNLTGSVSASGVVTLYAVTATVTDAGAGSGWDQGANPDQVVTLTDNLGATTAGVNEAFTTLETSAEGTVYRGVALTPIPGPLVLLLSGGLALVGIGRRSRGRER